MKNKKNLFEILKYSLIGISSTVINLIILYVFTEYFIFHYIISGAAAYIFSGVYNFSLNKIWTFKEKIGHRIVGKYLRFIILGGLFLAFNLLLLYSLTELMHIYYIFSQIISLLILATLNFFGNKFWVFRLKNRN